MQLGLRIDVDTFRGTKYGVPRLCGLLSAAGIRASFFFSVGPDNMGRHLWRLLKPAFLRKMLRSRAPNLYGWDILLRGTLLPGPVIGVKLARVIRAAAEQGHELGVHAWDHHAWQRHIEAMDEAHIHAALQRAFDGLREAAGTAPVCSAVPAWKADERVLMQKAKFPFVYNSDCRGDSVFSPVVDNTVLAQPQVPVTLPTYDELIGQGGIGAETYNDYILSLLRPDKLNVLTIHAEVEGIVCAGLFKRFLDAARQAGVTLGPLGALLPAGGALPSGRLLRHRVRGRADWVAVQAPCARDG
ncbi:MAG: 4-deoxy-4-formamido-L-arabinose-phosphoundecaprenol deformylase [Kiritimatiellae bacterium]|nr:4-deoxy-4-formamido-L-arabinose-phosphoundecaprenol deformylase [Kiritimatiellia bacterium]